MTAPLISADNSFALWAILLLVSAMAFSLEKTWIGRKMSGPILAIVTCAALSNLSIIPKSAAVYGSIWSYGVPVAIVLMLLNADIRKIIREAGPTLGAFCLAATGTVIGTLIGAKLVLSGPDVGALAGIFSATYIGGSLNFAAVAEAIGFENNTLLTASLAADNVVGTVFLAFIMAMPSMTFIVRFFGKSSHESAVTGASDTNATQTETSVINRLKVAHLAFALGLAFLIVAISELLAKTLGYPTASLLFATVITVLIATFFSSKVSVLSGTFPVGMLIMYLFFSLIGAGVDLAAMLSDGLLIAGFAAIILVTHLVILLGAGRLLNIGLPELLVASNACVVGPPAAAAMAAANRWGTLITPGVLCGTLGYVVANFVGISLYAVLG